MSTKRPKRVCIVCQTKDWSVTLYAFPKCPKLRAKWISNLKLEETKIRKRDCVCEKHFAKERFSSRCRIKPNAVPRLVESVPSEGKKEVEILEFKGPRITTDIKVVGDNNVNLVGRCTFCLEVLTDDNTVSESNASWTSLEHLWPYLMDKEDGNDVDAFNFAQKKSESEGLTFSKIPPMCSSCLPNIEALHNRHQELEQIRKRLAEQTKWVNEAALKIRRTLKESSKHKRMQVDRELLSSNVPSTCISSTTKFLDSLLGPSMTMAYTPFPIAPSSIAIIPAISTSGSQSQNLFVINTASYLDQGSSSLVAPNSTIISPSDLKSAASVGELSQSSIKKTPTVPLYFVANNAKPKTNQIAIPGEQKLFCGTSGNNVKVETKLEVKANILEVKKDIKPSNIILEHRKKSSQHLQNRAQISNFNQNKRFKVSCHINSLSKNSFAKSNFVSELSSSDDEELIDLNEEVHKDDHEYCNTGSDDPLA